ncbi:MULTISPECIES: hypothetical protein [unclassified Streptomyces]|uniref:WD40 repeat domain-containing protein n=1 Tax=unclassified Streptomyces TaxID=2593676 RepID=UPI000DBA4495|nr:MULTISPECIES: hypothetical protein [unclassified Streptomyces]MYT75208.1 hypothetical protein [Streptomyces sp. SID8367]RAJ77164.1 hypothetical protein K377_05922 [Streptomyces sp. PsTaAH-137]
MAILSRSGREQDEDRTKEEFLGKLDLALRTDPDPTLDLADSDAVCAPLYGERSVLLPWLGRLVKGGDTAKLRSLYAGESELHDRLGGLTGHQSPADLVRRLNEVSGLRVFGRREWAGLHAVRVQAGLALELVDPDPDPGRLAVALAWYESSGASPHGLAGPWTPGQLAEGDASLERALARLARTTGWTGGERSTGDAADGAPGCEASVAVTAVALALCRIALGRLPGRTRKPARVRTLYELNGVGFSGRLSLTVMRGGPHCLVPDPATMTLFTADEPFTEALGNAWQAAGGRLTGTVLWSLSAVEDSSEQAVRDGARHRIAGPSLGAAFAVLLHELARPLTSRLTLRFVTPSNAVSAAVTPGGQLESVTGIRAKVGAADGVKILVVAGRDGAEAQGAAAERPGGPEIRTAGDVQRAARHVRRFGWKTLALVLGPLLVTGLVLASYLAYEQRQNARAEARQKQARSLLNEAASVQDSDPAKALRLALTAHRIDASGTARDAMLRILLETRYRGEIPAAGAGGAPEAIAYTRGGRTFLTRTKDRVTVWDAVTRKKTATASTPRDDGPDTDSYRVDPVPVLLPLTAPGGSTVLIGTTGHRADLWSFADPAHPRRLGTLPGGQVLRAAVSGDGRTLAVLGPTGAADADGEKSQELRVYDVTDPAAPRRTGRFAGYSREEGSELGSVTVNHSGKLVAVTDGTTIRVHDAAKAALPTAYTFNPGVSAGADDPRPGGDINPTSDLDFGVDEDFGDILYSTTTHPLAASVGAGNKFVRMWRLDSGGAGGKAVLEETSRGMMRMVPGPHSVGAAVDEDGVILLGTGTVLRTKPGRVSTAPVTEESAPLFAYNPDGSRLAVRGDDGTVRFWAVDDISTATVADPPRSLKAHAFAAGASVLAATQYLSGTQQQEQETVLLDTSSGPPYRVLATLPEPADALGIDRDATRLAVLRQGVASLWDVSDRKHPRKLDATLELPADIAQEASGPSADGSGYATGGIDAFLVTPDGRTVVADLPGKGEALVWHVNADGTRAGKAHRLSKGAARPVTDGPGTPTPGDIPGDGAGPEEYETPPPGTPTPGNIPGDGAGPEEYDIASTVTLPDSPAASVSSVSASADAPDPREGVLSPDGRTLVLDGGAAGLAVWDLSGTGDPVRTHVIKKGAGSGRLVFSEDGHTLRTGTKGWTLDGDAAPRSADNLPVPKGVHDMDVVAEGSWGALGVSRSYKNLTVWFLRKGMEPVSVGKAGFGEWPEALALQPGRVLMGYSNFAERNATETVTAAKAPVTAACAATDRGLTRAELARYAEDAEWHPACPDE